MHELLAAQLKKYQRNSVVESEWLSFIEEVNQTYIRFDQDKERMFHNPKLPDCLKDEFKNVEDYIAECLLNMREAYEKEGEKLRTQMLLFEKFVPKGFLAHLQLNNSSVQLCQCVEKNMTVLFCDIRSFTALLEGMSPAESFEFINDYLAKLVPQISLFNGFVDKYIGDAIMAVFNTADEAVKAAFAMQAAVVQYNKERNEKKMSPIKIGIGIHTGLLMLGVVGAEERMQATVISDAVNLASRVEGLTSIFGASIIVTLDFVSQLVDKSFYRYRHLGTVQVIGKKNPISIFEALDPHHSIEKIENLRDFEKGINYYLNKNFVKAIYQFDKVLKKDLLDKAAVYYISKAAEYLIHGVPESGVGVEIMTAKSEEV